MLKPFAEVLAQDRNLIGEKAYQQALLWQQGINVPTGLVITTTLFSNFCKINAIDIDKLATNRNIDQQILQGELSAELAQQISQNLDQLYTEEPIYGFAVRSSAIGEDGVTDSFAGIHLTRLGIKRKDILYAIKECWASAFTPQAIGYRQEKGLPLSNIRIAVLIQPVIMPRVAGVAFTLNPVTGKSEFVINAAYGLGESVVSGQIEPDLYRLSKGNAILLLEEKIGSKATQIVQDRDALAVLPVENHQRLRPALSETEVIELAKQLQKLEDHFGQPQDVEWANDGNRLFILQTRPITTIPQKQALDMQWSRTNFREIVPELPSVYCSGLMAMSEPDFADYYREGGINVEHLRPIIKIIYGRPYFNLTIFNHLMETAGLPPETTFRMLGHGAEVSGKANYHIKLGKVLKNWRMVLNSYRQQQNYICTIEEVIKKTEIELGAIKKIDVSTLAYRLIPSHFEERRPYFLNFLYTSLSIGSAIMGKILGILNLIGDAIEEPINFINSQIAIGEKNISAQQALDLLKLGELARNDAASHDYFTKNSSYQQIHTALANTEFLRQFDLFIKKYGHRAIYETDPAQPRFYEDPNYLLTAIHNIVIAEKFISADLLCAQQEANAKIEYEQLSQNLRKKSIFGSIKLKMIKSQLKTLKKLFALRERVRYEGVRVISEQRKFWRQLALRLIKDGYLNQEHEIFYLSPMELLNLLGEERLTQLTVTVSQNSARHAFYAKLQPPNLVKDSEIDAIPSRSILQDTVGSKQFSGLAVSPGIVEGEVVVINHPGEFNLMKPGLILVAPATDPAWTPLFAVAIGVIVEIGGMLSHGSIVAREYGLPTVVNIPGITRRLHNGDRVIIDGAKGTVALLQSHNESASKP